MINENDDLYKVLGISQDATIQQIRRAYHRLAKTCHPDIVPAEREKFQRITDAYETLSNPGRRRAYDRRFTLIGVLHEYFLEHPFGRRAMSTLMDFAPSASRPGIDTVVVKEVSPRLLERGGVVSVRTGGTTIEVQIPPQSTATPWCCLHGLGEKGLFAENGDLWVLFQVRK
jgi:hypothetical protein